MLATRLHREGETTSGLSGEVFQLYGPTEAIGSTPRQPLLEKLLEVLKVCKALFERGTNIIILRSFASQL